MSKMKEQLKPESTGKELTNTPQDSGETKQALTIRQLIQSREVDIRNMLPTHVNFDRFLKSAFLAIARASKLQQCSPESVFTAIVNGAELGLDFTPAKGHAYLVPFWNTKKRCMEAQFMPGYRGFVELARRSGDVKMVYAHNVYENDVFDLEYGTNSRIVHKPCINKDRGKWIGAYAVVCYDENYKDFLYMDNDSLDGIKKRTKSKDEKGNVTGPWATDEGEMRKKTVMRRIAKVRPLSPDLEKAIEFDNKASGLEDANEIDRLDGKTQTERLAGLLTSQVVETSEAEEPKPDKEPEPENKEELFEPASFTEFQK